MLLCLFPYKVFDIHVRAIRYLLSHYYGNKIKHGGILGIDECHVTMWVDNGVEVRHVWIV